MSYQKHPPRGGQIRYVARQSKAMTVNLDKANITVPKGKRWLVHFGLIRNKSGAVINVGISVKGSSDKTISTIIPSTSIADGAELHFPWKEGTEQKSQLGHGAFPLLLGADQYLQFWWGADAGKSGTSHWFAQIEEFTP